MSRKQDAHPSVRESGDKRDYRGAFAGAFVSLASAGWLLALLTDGSASARVVEVPELRIHTSVGAPAAPVAPAWERARDGHPIMPADPKAGRPQGPVHPHPITNAHERIYRENNLVGALNLAVDLEDASRIHELVATYRAEYPEDDHVLQGGYELIAACLEQSDGSPDRDLRARAQAFWSTHIRSETRRYVRRYCLDR